MYKLILHTEGYRSDVCKSFNFKTKKDLIKLIKKSKLVKLSGEIVLKDDTKLVFSEVDFKTLVELYDMHAIKR